MAATHELVFPLIPSRRSRALDVAGRASRRRGRGDEIAGSRPYRRGDAIRLIDWAASARLSTAHGSDEFVVRDHYGEDVVRVVVVVDRGPSMSLFPDHLPWLDKPTAVREAAMMIIASGAATSALIGFAEAGATGTRIDRPARDPRLRRAIERRLATTTADGPPDSLDHVLDRLLRYRSNGVPAGTFVFVLSDFVPPVHPASLRAAADAGWDVIPVIVQDPVWERSFPDVSGVTLPLADPDCRTLTLVRLTRAEALARREENEARAALLDGSMRELGFDTVNLTSSDRDAVYAAFAGWAERRAAPARGRG
jgi:uncharacterized protein (DUF58 family)